MPREAAVSLHCTFLASNGESLRAAEAKCAVPGRWMRLGFSGKC